MTPQDEGSVVDKVDYKDHEVAVVEKETEHELRVDGNPVTTQRDADTGAYWSPDVPFRTFGSLQELGRAMVDEGVVGGQDGE
jgi:hypothetical protein